MARIVRVEYLMVDLAAKTVRVDAIQSFTSQETPIVRITDSDGAVGTGYSYTIGTGGASVMALIERTFAPALIGEEAEAIEGIWQMLSMRSHATMVGPITAAALAAIDTALWDLRCRRANLPLHLMAGGARASIPVYSTEGGWLNRSREELVEDAHAARERGLKAVKLKVGLPLADDCERIAAVADALGRGAEVFVDANQSFALDEAVRRAHAYEELGIGWLEEPLPADDVAGHTALARSTSVPVAVGESLYSVGQFRDYLQRGACSIVQVDVGRVGGITPWLKVAHMAEGFNVAVCPHFLMELHVALCCAVPNARWLEYIPQLDGIVEAPLSIDAGEARPSDEAGLGIAWDLDKVGRLAQMQGHAA